MMSVFNVVLLRLITLMSLLFYYSQALPSTESEFRAFRVGLSSEGFTSAVALATDDHGNTFIVGNTDGSFGKADGDNVSSDSIFIAKFSRSGILIWLTRTGSAYLDIATSIYFFGTNIYVTGYTKGNVTLGAQPRGTRMSRGIKDGFIVVYNSFTGKRLWSKQYGVKATETQIEHVAVTKRGGIIIAGRTNASLFLNENRAVKDQEFFLARLQHATGHPESKVQIETRSVWPFSWPQRLLVVEETSSVYVVLHSNEHDRRRMGVVVSVQFHKFGTFERVMNVGGQIADADSNFGLAHDRRSGKLVVSFTKGSSSTTDTLTSNFALRIVSNKTRPRQWTERIFSFDRGGEDIVRDVVVNEAGFALVLGSSEVKAVQREDRRTEKSAPALWVYDVRKMKSVGSHIADNIDGLHCDKITTFDLDSDGNIVYAGVRHREDGTGEVLLGSFGVPAEYKWRSEDGASKPVKVYILDSGSITSNEMLAVQDSKRSEKGGEQDRRDSLNLGSIASICVGSALVVLVVAGLYAITMRGRKRTGVEREGNDTLSNHADVHHQSGVGAHGERPQLEHLFNDTP